MENVNNISSKNLQGSIKDPRQPKETDSFFNEILSSSKNKLSLSGKYIQNIKTDNAGSYNKQYSFAKNNAEAKLSEEKNNTKDIYKNRENNVEKHEDKALRDVKTKSSQESLNKPPKDDVNKIKSQDKINEDSDRNPTDDIDEQSATTNKSSNEIDKSSNKTDQISEEISDETEINNAQQIQGLNLNEQQIKDLSAWIINQFNNVSNKDSDSPQIDSQIKNELIHLLNAKPELVNILTDKTSNLNDMVPKLQGYIQGMISSDKANLDSLSGDADDNQLLNSILEKLFQTKGIEDSSKTSVKQANNLIVEEVPAILENAISTQNLSAKNLQNQLQFLKTDADGNLFSGEKGFMKELMISDKKVSEQLMDFSSQKIFVQTVSTSITAAPLTNRNASFIQMISKISDEIRLTVENHKTQMTIRLEPEALGRLTVKVTSENGIMNASFYAENDKAKTMIENHMAELRNSLESQGIQIQNLTVTVDQNQQELNRHKNIMEAKTYSKNKGMGIQQIDETDNSILKNPYFTQDLFNDLI